ncbi:MarR family transcriptional regulator [Sphingopyxis sp. J-6]|uniref:MarR family winged helix-turn-helix transcriptional regulator n=1 Tax=Sphingopyxis sp. J-6 TaxID=3122054 RepID=UPI003983F7AB
MEAEGDKTLGMRIMKLSRLLRLRFDRRAAGAGLTSAQWRTIACVRRFPGATQREIAGLLEVGEVTVGRSIDRLAEAGWLERRADPADRRAYRIHLTGAIDPLLAELAAIGAAEDADALAGFSAAEIAALDAMLERIAANLGGEVDPAVVAGCDPREAG